MTEQDILIRDATAEDLPAILEIYNHSILDTTAVYDYKPHTLSMREEWFAQKQQTGQPVLVAVKERAIAGFASYGPFRMWAAYKYTVENSIHVHPLFQGQGIGKQLLAVTIEKAKQADIHVVMAGIDATNKASISLHTGFGFKRAGCFEQVGFKFNRWLDLEFYQLLLQTPEHPAE